MNTFKFEFILIIVFVAFIAFLGLIPPFFVGPVPITAQSFGIIMAGLVLGPRYGVIAVAGFLLCIALGLPLLSGGRGGIGVFFGPTAGYLVGFILAAFLAGFISRFALIGNPFVSALVASIVATVLGIYPLGILWLVFGVPDISLKAALANNIWFIVGDSVKALLAAYCFVMINKYQPSVLR